MGSDVESGLEVSFVVLFSFLVLVLGSGAFFLAPEVGAGAVC
jgi:hypothetical protein